MEVRTHNVREVKCSHVRCRHVWLECRGCGERWSCDDIDRDTLERQPCGTREGA